VQGTRVRDLVLMHAEESTAACAVALLLAPFADWWRWSFVMGGSGALTAVGARGYPVEVIARVMIITALAAVGLSVWNRVAPVRHWAVKSQNLGLALGSVNLVFVFVLLFVPPRNIGRVPVSPAVGAWIGLVAALAGLAVQLASRTRILSDLQGDSPSQVDRVRSY
jgi:hypothetical protein